MTKEVLGGKPFFHLRSGVKGRLAAFIWIALTAEEGR